MSPKKNLCALIDVELHEKITAEKEKSGLNLNEFVEGILYEYYILKEGGKMGNEDTKTLALQISAELMERVKSHLKKHKITQKAFIISLIENALDDKEKSEITSQNDADQG